LSKSSSIWNLWLSNVSRKFINYFLTLSTVESLIKINYLNSLHLAQKYARVFFPRTQICSKKGEQFPRNTWKKKKFKWMLLWLCFFKYFPQRANLVPRAFHLQGKSPGNEVGNARDLLKIREYHFSSEKQVNSTKICIVFWKWLKSKKNRQRSAETR